MRQIKALHWMSVGKSKMLSITQARKPSVIQIRKQGMELTPLADLLTSSVHLWESELENGAILTLDAKRGRVRLLPLVHS